MTLCQLRHAQARIRKIKNTHGRTRNQIMTVV